MNRHFWTALMVAGAIAVPTIAQAQTQRTDIFNLTSRRTELAQQSNLTISGRVAQIEGNEFGLSDLTGQIVVRVGNDFRQRPANLAVGQQITVVGQVGQDRKFIANRITLPNGNVINVPSGNTEQSNRPQ